MHYFPLIPKIPSQFPVSTNPFYHSRECTRRKAFKLHPSQSALNHLFPRKEINVVDQPVQKENITREKVHPGHHSELNWS